MFWSRRPPEPDPSPPPPLPPAPPISTVVEIGSCKGGQVGALAGVSLSPVAWLVQRMSMAHSLRWYADVLPRMGAAGVCGGALAGAAASFTVASNFSEGERQAWAHATPPDDAWMLAQDNVWLKPTPENLRCKQWGIVGLATGVVLSTPGPGGSLFQETPWHWRLGGGAAVGVAVFTLGFAASCHPMSHDYLPWLPEGMQPEWAKQATKGPKT
jgi:hypothetical protein